MIGILITLALCLAPLPEQLLLAWHHRYVLFLGMEPSLKPLPKELAEGGCPPLKLEDYSLPIGRYTAAELQRNRLLYGESKVMLQPKYIVLHFTVIPEAAEVLEVFSRPTKMFLGNHVSVTSLVTVHYMVDKDGVILALVPEDRRTSGTYGLDHRALSIEMVASDEKDLLSRPVQLLSTFCLVDGLLKKHKLPVWAVISHQEVAMGDFFLSDYTDVADPEYPYFYPRRSFRFDPGHTVMAWCREFLLRRRQMWQVHPAFKRELSPTPSASPQ